MSAECMKGNDGPCTRILVSDIRQLLYTLSTHFTSALLNEIQRSTNNLDSDNV